MPSSDVTTLKGIFLLKIIFVFILFSDGGEVEVVVHIVQENRKKPFLGGYKHRLTGVEFHNAAAQTIPKIHVPSFVEKFLILSDKTYTLCGLILCWTCFLAGL